MLDFVEIGVKDLSTTKKPGVFEVYPIFQVIKSKDLMIKAREFYAFWDAKSGFWNKDMYALGKTIDEELYSKKEELLKDEKTNKVNVKSMQDETSNSWNRFCKYIKSLPDNWHQLDSKVIFSGENTKKSDYASFTLGYALEDCDISAYEEMISTLYKPSEREKIEWAIGSVIAGDSIDIQKFYVFYGDPGSGKSTILDIIELLFEGYHKGFKSEELGKSSSSFNLEALKDNPLVAIDHEGKLDRIDNNTVINSIVSHDEMIVNVKFASKYTMKFNTTMFIGSNSAVNITDGKSGLTRRLIDIYPSGVKIPPNHYLELKDRVAFELGGIAKHCLELYLKLGRNYYLDYKPTNMIAETNDMYNFVSEMAWDWKEQGTTTLVKAWHDYLAWCEDARVTSMRKSKFKVELMDYFEHFYEYKKGLSYVYETLKEDKFKFQKVVDDGPITSWLDLKEGISSIFDKECADCFAQYATEDEIPGKSWKSVTSKLSELDTSRLHYVKVPENHIVIDFDIKNENGEKDFLLNLRAASKFPKTYAEVSKGGAGIHLHYIYSGDVSRLSSIYDVDIEVKVFRGGASLRRKLTKCNDIPIATIGSGLPIKEEKPMVDKKAIENERHLIVMIKKCLNKEFHGHTAPEVDFIKHLTDQAYATEGLSYDIRSMKPAIVSFAMNSSNQAQKCYNTVATMHLCSKDVEENEVLYSEKVGDDAWKEAPIVFFDIEIFPNLFVICWKILGSETVNSMINPTPKEVEELFKYRLVGFYNRRYDNHMIYARSMGYSIQELYNLSRRLTSGSKNATFASAYGLSYTDVWDYCSNKNRMSLKKWEIKLGIYHLENSHPWNEPIDEKYWGEIVDYCKNDVIATEAVWNATQDDFTARCILAELSGLTVNDSSNAHTQQYIFGDDKHPQSQFNCPDLRKEFPGYEFKNGVSTYLGEKVSEGGWVFFKPGMYTFAKCFDISGMHPHSAYKMKIFGDYYTERYYDLVRARTYIKHKEYDKVRKMFDGKLAKYLENEKSAKALSDALKTPINAVYGLTSANYENRCRDPRNKENIVAKRGALFMITLKHKLDDMGYEVIHCKTDSIKVVNPDEKVEKFILDFGKKYGYDFEVEDEFKRICLVNGSTFIALTPDNKWEAKAAQFAHPYVFKTLFSHEEVEFKDLCETKSVDKGGAIYLDFNESLPSVEDSEKLLKKTIKDDPNNTMLISKLQEDIKKGHDYRFVGKVGLFTPVCEGTGGALLVCKKDAENGVDKYDFVQGAKGHRWFESGFVTLNHLEGEIDMSYFEKLNSEAIKNIEKYGDFDIFANGMDDEYESYIELRDSEYEKMPVSEDDVKHQASDTFSSNMQEPLSA